MSNLHRLEEEGGHCRPTTVGDLVKLRVDQSVFLEDVYPDETINPDRHNSGYPLHYCSLNPQGHVEFTNDEEVFSQYAEGDAEAIVEDPGYLLHNPINLRAFSYMEPAQFSEIVTYYKLLMEVAYGDKRTALWRMHRMLSGLENFLFEKQDGGLVRAFFNGPSIRDFVNAETGVIVGRNLVVHFEDVFSLPPTEHWGFGF